MHARTVAALLAALILAGCAFPGDGTVDDEGAPAHAWLPGDRWSYRLALSDGPATDEWTVLGGASFGDTPVLQVQSTTVRASGASSSEVGSFDARTLALRHVEGDGLVLDFDPAEVWLLPAEDRTYTSQVTETRPQGQRTARIAYTVTYEGEDSIDTEAGFFSAERFTVRRTTLLEGGSREETSTYWWAPVAMNVVRQDSGGVTVKTLTSYALVDGPRTVPG